MTKFQKNDLVQVQLRHGTPEDYTIVKRSGIVTDSQVVELYGEIVAVQLHYRNNRVKIERTPRKFVAAYVEKV